MEQKERMMLQTFNTLREQVPHLHGSEQRAMENEIVALGTTETTDVFSTIWAYDTALQLMTSGQTQSSSRIIQGLNMYFQERQVVHKQLLNATSKEEVYHQVIAGQKGLKDLIGRFAIAHSVDPFQLHFFGKLLSETSGRIFRFIDEFNQAQRSQNGYQIRLDFPIVFSDVGKRLPYSEAVLAAYETVNKSCILSETKLNLEEALDPVAIRRKVHPAENVVGLATDSLNFHVFGVPEFFDQSFSGTTLRNLFEEEDAAKFHGRALRFFAQAIQGDVFWQRVLKNIFLLPPFHVNVKTTRGIYAHPEYMQKIFYFQMHLAQCLFLPTLLTDNRAQELIQKFGIRPAFDTYMENQKENDALLSSIIGHLDRTILDHFAESLYTTTRAGSIALLRFLEDENPKSEIADGYINYNFAPMQLLINLMEGEKDKDQVFNFQDERSHEFFHERWRELHEALQSRFYASPYKDRMYKLFNLFGNQVGSREFAQIHSDVFAQRMITGLGEDFIDELQNPAHEMRGMLREIWQNIFNSDEMYYWLEGEELYPFLFPKQSMMRAMGFDVVEFVHPTGSDALDFHLTTIKGKAGVRGKINFHGEFTHFSVALEGKYEPLQLALGLGISSAFRELIRRRVIVRDISEKRPRGKRKNHGEDHASSDGSGDNRIQMVRTPRTVYVYEGDSDPEITLGESDDTNEANGDPRQRQPYYVDRYTRRTQPGANYCKKLIEKWAQADEHTRAAMFDEVARAIRAVHKTSEFKVKSAPPNLKPVTIPNPLYFLDPSLPPEIMLTTWKKPYDVPKLPEDMPVKEKLRIRVFQGGASTLTFVDNLWMEWNLVKKS